MNTGTFRKRGQRQASLVLFCMCDLSQYSDEVTCTMAAFCEPSKGRYNEIAAWIFDGVFNFELCNRLPGPKENCCNVLSPLEELRFDVNV